MENATTEKTLGLILLFAGLVIIGYSLYLGVNVFINAQNPPEIIKSANIADAPAQQAQPAITPAPLPKNISEISPNNLQQMTGGDLITPEMIKSIIPPEMFTNASKLMNLSIFSIFLWVLITAGAKISGLGIVLIKTNSSVKL